MILEHFAPSPVALTPRSYVQPGRIFSHQKPTGLWVSVKGDDDWPTWCEEESFCPERMAFCYRVEIASDANVRIVEGVAELDSFHEEFALEWTESYSWKSYGIDWRAVAERYQGLIIAPYIWSRRLHRPVSDWYYGWDCASGCIWDLSAIASFDLVARREAA